MRHLEVGLQSGAALPATPDPAVGLKPDTLGVFPILLVLVTQWQWLARLLGAFSRDQIQRGLVSIQSPTRNPAPCSTAGRGALLVAGSIESRIRLAGAGKTAQQAAQH